MRSIAGLMMTDMWAERVAHADPATLTETKSAPAQISVLIKNVELAHHNADRKYRPYLHVYGELRYVMPADRLANDIGKVTFPLGQGDGIDAFYEFDDKELLTLVERGYFEPAFKAPDNLIGIEVDFPATIDTLVVAPESGVEDDLPLVFVRVHNAGNLELDFESWGYDLSEVFDDVSDDNGLRFEQPEFSVPSAATTAARPRDLLFDEDDLALAGLDSPVQKQTTTRVTTDFEARLREVAKVVEAEREALATDLESSTGSIENLYAERVSARIDEE